MEILNDKDLNKAVYSMVDDCQTNLILITPYFDPPERLKKRIVNAANRGVQVTLIIRDIRKEEHAFLTSSTKNSLNLMLENGVSVRWVTWLHAKIYISEKHAIISSLNLLETSFELSKETGVQFPSISSAFVETMKRADELRRDAEDYIASISSPAQKQRLDDRGQEVAAGGGSSKKQRLDNICQEGAAGGSQQQQNPHDFPQCLDCSFRGPQITIDKPRCYNCWRNSNLDSDDSDY
jgi:phosphatidylserine/phosphatidylglycerophosphate/cardiolipin synthase-like enzyme